MLARLALQDLRLERVQGSGFRQGKKGSKFRA